MTGRSLCGLVGNYFFDSCPTEPWKQGIYLVTKAASPMALQTSRNETSFVRVYPCNTLGSARLAVDGVVHGTGKDSDPSGSVEVQALLEAGLYAFFFFRAIESSDSEEEDDLASPSQTSISMQRHPRRRTLCAN